jgi:ABC-type transport system involved in multi-copper enzyme maturation permease subunit
MVANSELQRVKLSGWRTGLANLLGKENRAWWASRRWLVQSILWTVVVNGFTALFALGLPLLAKIAGNPAVGLGDPLDIGVELLFKLGVLALGIGAIVLVNDAIIGERQLGVTEWLLSKPMSRSSYVLSKLLAHGLGVLVVLVGLQSALGYGLLSLIIGEPFPLPGYLVGVCGLAVHTLFYLALTLMMGVLTASRGKLLGVPLGALLGGTLFGGFLGMFAMLTPWALADVLPAAVLGLPLPLPVWLPIGVTAILSVISVAVALARFERLEF